MFPICRSLNPQLNKAASRWAVAIFTLSIIKKQIQDSETGQVKKTRKYML